MRVFVLLALLFAFTVGGYSNSAYSAVPDLECTHHQMEHNQNTDTQKEPCHSEQDQEQCDDCCCVHSHSMTITPIPVSAPSYVKHQDVVTHSDSYRSAELSGLRRPPRL